VYDANYTSLLGGDRCVSFERCLYGPVRGYTHSESQKGQAYVRDSDNLNILNT